VASIDQLLIDTSKYQSLTI